MMSQRVPTVVVGFGFAGSDFHCPLVGASQYLALEAVVTSKSEEEVERKLGRRVACYKTLAEAVQSNSDLRLVVVATPNRAHAACAEEALRLGLHVVVDKPFTCSVAEADRLLSRHVSVFQNRKYDCDFLTVQKVLQSGELGRIVQYRSEWRRWRPDIKANWRWKADEPASGLLWDLGPHMLHQVLLLFGVPSAISCVSRKQRVGAETDDYFLITTTHAQQPQLVCHLEGGVLFHGQFGERTFCVYGDRGSFEKTTGIDPQEGYLKEAKLPKSPGWGEEPVRNHGVMSLVGEEPRVVPSERGDYVQFYDHVGHYMLGTAPTMPVSAAEGRTVVALIEAAVESARLGKTVQVVI